MAFHFGTMTAVRKCRVYLGLTLFLVLPLSGAFVRNAAFRTSSLSSSARLFGVSSASLPTSSTTTLGDVCPVQIVDEMPDPLPTNLKNKYYLLRHGQSTANVAEIISSSRSLAYTKKHGLTAFGYEQGKESATQLLDVLEKTVNAGEQVVLVSSPFARAYQTARACLDGLEDESERVDALRAKLSTDIVVNDKLVERYFGRLDAEAIYTYAYVWPLDKHNVTHTAFDVESVAAVCARLREVVQELEETYSNCHLVWVSHADVLQIAQLYAAGVDNVGLFSSFRFKNGEVRPMLLSATDALPEPVPLEAPQRGTRTLELVPQ